MGEKLSKEEEIIEKLTEIKEKTEVVSRIISVAKQNTDLINMKYSNLKTIKEILNAIFNEVDRDIRIFGELF